MRKKILGIILTILVVAGLAVWYFHDHTVAVLQPRGSVAYAERRLIIVATLLSAIVVIPVFILLFVFAWKYREANSRARYSPNWDHNRVIETIWWLIPASIILVLSVITWQSSHALDPYRSLASTVQPIQVEVVALQWKWLFIYPQEGIATVNYLRIPTGTPVNFNITSDAPMNSFWVPQLGGQVYAMSGMNTQLHLEADTPGMYTGSSANISGTGFADMAFKVQASSHADYAAWLSAAHKTHKTLTNTAYSKLAQPSTFVPSTMYSSVEDGLYDSILMKYMSPDHDMHMPAVTT